MCPFPVITWHRITEYPTEIINSEELGLCLPLTSRNWGFYLAPSNWHCLRRDLHSAVWIRVSFSSPSSGWLMQEKEVGLWCQWFCVRSIKEGGLDDLKGFFQHKQSHGSILCVNYTAECASALLSNSPTYVLHKLRVILCSVMCVFMFHSMKTNFSPPLAAILVKSLGFLPTRHTLSDMSLLFPPSRCPLLQLWCRTRSWLWLWHWISSCSWISSYALPSRGVK